MKLRLEYQRAYRQANLEKLRTQERENARRYRAEHPDKVKAAAAKSRQKHKVVLRDKMLNDRYGLLSGQYELMLEAQGGVCAICKQPETHKGRHGIPKLAVDHDHVTGKVRGLLCWNCNTTIGRMNDDPALLRAAAQYLDGHQPSNSAVKRSSVQSMPITNDKTKAALQNYLTAITGEHTHAAEKLFPVMRAQIEAGNVVEARATLLEITSAVRNIARSINHGIDVLGFDDDDCQKESADESPRKTLKMSSY